MHIFSGRDLNDVYLSALEVAASYTAAAIDSRAGMVYDLGPAYFEFTAPENQLLTLRNRKFNPYFAIIEAAWILSGEKTLAPLQAIIKNYSKFSDDGASLNGAYGYRIRNYFGIDQIDEAIIALRKSPSSRRVVLTLYSPSDLANDTSADIPCNTTIYLKIRDDKLDATIINRSNDLFLGIPYNVFVFNCLQKFIAYHLKISEGTQRHFTDSLHLYEKDKEKVKKILTSNNQNEISEWQSQNTPKQLYECIINEYKPLSELDKDSINCTYTRKLISDYVKFRADNNSIDLKHSLPYDIAGTSIQLWLESEKLKENQAC